MPTGALGAAGISTMQSSDAADRPPATGKLADPTDLPFTDELLDDDGLVDDDKVQTAVDDLIARKPYLAAAGPGATLGRERGRSPRRSAWRDCYGEAPEVRRDTLVADSDVSTRG